MVHSGISISVQGFMKYTVILEDMCATVLCARTGGKWMWNRSEVRPHCSCIQRPSWWALTWQGESLRSAQTVTWSDSQTCQFAWKTEAARPVKVKAIIALLSSLFTAKSLGWLQKVWASHAVAMLLWFLWFEVVVMLFFGVALSQIVTDLAVTPLERMLGTSMIFPAFPDEYLPCSNVHVITCLCSCVWVDCARTVREIAATVFRFSLDPDEQEVVRWFICKYVIEALSWSGKKRMRDVWKIPPR